jgi:hypothetical protein
MDSKNPVFTDAIDDLTAAMAAHDKIMPNVKMATNGWVVGPLPDRSIFDKELPSTWDAITSIDLNTVRRNCHVQHVVDIVSVFSDRRFPRGVWKTQSLMLSHNVIVAFRDHRAIHLSIRPTST